MRSNEIVTINKIEYVVNDGVEGKKIYFTDSVNFKSSVVVPSGLKMPDVGGSVPREYLQQGSFRFKELLDYRKQEKVNVGK